MKGKILQLQEKYNLDNVAMATFMEISPQAYKMKKSDAPSCLDKKFSKENYQNLKKNLKEAVKLL